MNGVMEVVGKEYRVERARTSNPISARLYHSWMDYIPMMFAGLRTDGRRNYHGLCAEMVQYPIFVWKGAPRRGDRCLLPLPHPNSIRSQ